jgi:Zn-dependent peptidase ImmA (M78 family)
LAKELPKFNRAVNNQTSFKLSSKAYINKAVLRWARESAKFSLKDASAKMNVSEERMSKWETVSSEEYPTIKQAERLAKIYKRPFAVLFLPSVPKDFQVLRDFRSMNRSEFSTSLVFMTREILEKQGWLREYLIEASVPKRIFAGKFSVNDSPENVASDIRATLEINKQFYKDNALAYWTTAAESKGIFVSLSSFIHTRLKLDPDEFKGFAISDDYAPFIFVNANDWKNSKLFTLVHELAHIWINESGVSDNTDITLAHSKSANPIETFCNRVAANALLPKEEITKCFTESEPAEIEDFENLSKAFGVSCLTLLIRSFELGLISKATFGTLKLESESRFTEYVKRMEFEKEKMKKSEGGPSPYLLRARRNGKAFSSIVLDGYRGGAISGAEASRLLSVKMNKFQNLEKYVYG